MLLVEMIYWIKININDWDIKNVNGRGARRGNLMTIRRLPRCARKDINHFPIHWKTVIFSSELAQFLNSG